MKKITTRKQLVEKLNKIDMKCIDYGKHFYDLKTLFESVEDKLTAQDRTDLKRMLSVEDDPEVISAAMEAKLKEEYEEEDIFGDDNDLDESYDHESKFYLMACYESSLRGLEDDLNTDDYSEAMDFVWDKCQQGLWVSVDDTETGEVTVYSPEKFDETTMDPEDLREDFDINEDYEDGSFDYFVAYDGDNLIGEYPTYDDAKEACTSPTCVVKGVIQYGADGYEETIID